MLLPSHAARKSATADSTVALVMVVDPNMGGGMSSKQLVLTVATSNFAAVRAAFITEVATTLSSATYTVEEKYVFITGETVTGSNTALTVQVVGKSIAAARTTVLEAKTTLGGVTIVGSIVAT